jgi:hypothetical protein
MFDIGTFKRWMEQRKKKLIWRGCRQNIHSQKKNADGNCKQPFIYRAICKGHETDALKYSRNGIIPLSNEIRDKSKKKKKRNYLVHDLESTGQPAVTEAAEAAPLWEQVINICWWRLRNNNMQYGALPHCKVTRYKNTYCWIVVSTFISDGKKEKS